MDFQQSFYKLVDDNKEKLPDDFTAKIDNVITGEIILSGLIMVPNEDFSEFSSILLTTSRLILVKPVNKIFKYVVLFLENLEYQEFWMENNKNYYHLRFNDNRKIDGSVDMKYQQYDKFIKMLNQLLISGAIKKVFNIPPRVKENKIEGFVDHSEDSEVSEQSPVNS